MTDLNIFDIAEQTNNSVQELLNVARLKNSDILVVGCSTSEICGKIIGSSGSENVAEAVFGALIEKCTQNNLCLAVQCCEHLNRAIVVERKCAEKYFLDEVNVLPVLKAGGALATVAMKRFDDPVVVENIKAHAALDIGNTLIGMHLKPVAVPVRLSNNIIGKAFVNGARTRAKLIGGSRATYQ